MNLRSTFPVLQTTTYLNTAGSGILYDSLYRWRKDHELAFMEKGSDFRLNQASFLESVKDSVATFFNADRQHTYLVANFSSGYSTLLDGLTAGHRILLLGSEFPAVYYQAQCRGFASETLSLGDHLEERIMDAVRTFQPTIFAFSIVQYSNGVKLGFDFLAELKQLFPGLLLIADGTQYCGTEAVDFNRSPLDALLGSSYKWLLGGYGSGYALLKENIASQLYTNVQHLPLPVEAFMKHKTRLALRFEPGHQDTLSFGSLQHSLSLLTTTGMDVVRNTANSLSVQAKEAFAERGLLDDYVVKRKCHSTIFRLNIGEDLISKIQSANITGTSRSDGFRVSFHFYNETKDLDRLLEVIDANR